MKFLFLSLFFAFTISSIAQNGFTQSDRERAIRTEVTLQEFMKATDKRFDLIEKNANSRFEAIDKRFEDANQRFEDMNKRFEDMNNFLLIIITVFAATAGGVFVYIIWDRKTFMTVALQNAKEMVDGELKVLQKEGKLPELIKAMRELAQDDPKVKNVLAKFHLL